MFRQPGHSSQTGGLSLVESKSSSTGEGNVPLCNSTLTSSEAKTPTHYFRNNFREKIHPLPARRRGNLIFRRAICEIGRSRAGK